MKMTFGKYRETDLVDIPLDYLTWLEQQNIADDLRKAINFEIERRKSPVTSKGKNVQLLDKDKRDIL